MCAEYIKIHALIQQLDKGFSACIDAGSAKMTAINARGAQGRTTSALGRDSSHWNIRKGDDRSLLKLTIYNQITLFTLGPDSGPGII